MITFIAWVTNYITISVSFDSTLNASHTIVPNFLVVVTWTPECVIVHNQLTVTTRNS